MIIVRKIEEIEKIIEELNEKEALIKKIFVKDKDVLPFSLELYPLEKEKSKLSYELVQKIKSLLVKAINSNLGMLEETKPHLDNIHYNELSKANIQTWEYLMSIELPFLQSEKGTNSSVPNDYVLGFLRSIGYKF
jgi:predicted nuclease with TOPRIM domain